MNIEIWLVPNLLGNVEGGPSVWPTNVEGQLGDHFDDFFLRDAILLSRLHVVRKLFKGTLSNQSCYGNHAPVTRL